MKEIKVSVNTWYVVEGTAGATVTNPSTNRVIATIEDGKQATFYATTPYVLASDDSVSVYKATFNSAPAKLRLLGLLGGGEPASALPEGYIAAEFLEGTGTQYITIRPNPIKEIEFVEVEATMQYAITGTRQLSGCSVFVWWEVNPSGRLGLNGSYISPATHKQTFVFHWSKNEDVYWLDTEAGRATSPYSGEAKDFGVRFFALYFHELNSVQSLCKAKLWKANIDMNGTKFRLVPCLTSDGQPVLHDLLGGGDYGNWGTGQFVVGMTCKQALQLAKLPAGGGSLTVSLPTGYESDAGVMSALETARANGWTITVQTYEAETAAATFGMRRIWVRRQQDEHGTYIDTDGNRWQVDWCVAMYTPDGSEPDAHGYEMFRSVDAAVAYWELEPWVDPNAEELLTEYKTNE